MSNLELKIKNILADLKTNHNVVGLKSEFEAEGASCEETKYLADMAKSAGLNFTVKIGGCGAVNDIRISKSLDTDTLVAPMIESSFAVQKFVESVDSVFESSKQPKLLINIETVSGMNCFDEIIESSYYDRISGIVFGRSDMVKSLGKSCDATESSEILELAKSLSEKVLKSGKIFIVGGGISPKSYDFLKSLEISNFETRKIIFDRCELDKDCQSGILKALEFEIIWYRLKQELYGNISKSDIVRLDILQRRYEAQALLNL